MYVRVKNITTNHNWSCVYTCIYIHVEWVINTQYNLPWKMSKSGTYNIYKVCKLRAIHSKISWANPNLVFCSSSYVNCYGYGTQTPNIYAKFFIYRNLNYHKNFWFLPFFDVWNQFLLPQSYDRWWWWWEFCLQIHLHLSFF